MTTRRVAAWMLSTISLATLAQPGRLPAQTDASAGFLPGVQYQADIPTLQQVVGHAWGERMSTHSETARYLRALADASPKVTMHEYGAAWSGKALHYLVVASEANHERLDAIRAGMAQLADPRTLTDADTDALVRELPTVTWLAFSVHGDEVSCTDAGLFLAYHIVAAQQDEVVQAILQNSVLIIDPLVNPDGRDRFVHHFRDTTGRFLDASPAAIEHDQGWPGGRVNHYLFDLNRDWFARTQPETRARVAEFLRWRPVVYVDAHEMGRNSSYYFAPPAEPVHPEITSGQREWLTRYGRNNAEWFDRFGIDYFTREAFDAFYPGYGDCWPLMQGSIGMTYEQASPLGLVMRRDDETELTYHNAVRNHVVATLATAETAAKGREAALRAFVEYRQSATVEGREGDGPREYVFPLRPGRDYERVRRLMRNLRAQGIEVRQSTTDLRNLAAARLDEPDAKLSVQTFPSGSYLVSLAQPSKRLAHALLARHFDMPEAFLEEQIAHEAHREGTSFYDLTGWSLPLLFDVECWTCADVSVGTSFVANRIPAPDIEPLKYDAGTVAYLVDGVGTHAARFLSACMRRGVRARCADKEFSIGGRTYPPGSIVIPTAGNPDDLTTIIREEMRSASIQVRATTTSWVDDGIHFGSNHMVKLPAPKVALAWDRPTSPVSAGCVRWLLEHEYGCPVTPIRTSRLSGRELDRFNVLILPSGGGYAGEIGKSGAERIKRWVRGGGTLITLGAATQWLTGEDVSLLASQVERRKGPGKEDAESSATAESKAAASKPSGVDRPNSAESNGDTPFDYDREIQPDDESPARTPGAILRVKTHAKHWLAFGYEDREAFVVANSRRVFTPVKLDRGTNVVVYAEQERLLVSGFAWPHKQQQIAHKAYLVHQPHGRGHVVAFAEDPTLRGITEGLQLLLMNAVLLGPGH